MRLVRRIAAVVLVLLVAAVVGGYFYARPLLKTGTGYAAHNSCAVTLVADRDDPDSDLPDNPLVPFLTGYVNEAGGSSTSQILFALSTQKAWFTRGFGCTLAAERPNLGEATKVVADTNPLSEAPAPEPDEQVDAAIGRAFGDDLSPSAAQRLGTRGIVVLRDGQLIGERYAPGFEATTPQLGWSMGKSVTSLMLGRMVLEKRIAVDDTGLRPEWTDARKDISVDQLLRMTSGLTWDETYALGTPITQMLYAEPDMAAVRRQPAAGAPARQLPAVLERFDQHPVRGAHRPRRHPGCRPAPPAAVRPARRSPRRSGSRTPPARRCAARTCGRPRGTGPRSASSPSGTACGPASGCCPRAG